MPPAPAGSSRPRRYYSYYDPFRLRWFHFVGDSDERVYEPEDPPLTERERQSEILQDLNWGNGDMNR